MTKTIGNKYMLWFEGDSKKTFVDIVREGQIYHKNKYGLLPAHVHVSEKTAIAKEVNLNEISMVGCEVHVSKNIGFNCYGFSVESTIEPQEKDDEFNVDNKLNDVDNIIGKSKFKTRKG